MTVIYFMEIINESLPVDLLTIVSKDKWERIERFKFNIDKKLSLYSDLLVRCLACQALNLNIQELTFSTNRYGKPFLLGYPKFQYNISHTRSAVTIGISEEDIGIDVERVGAAPLDIAKRFFVVNETDYILSSGDIDKRFYEIWTKKEAYIKRIGKGLSIPLNTFNVLDMSTTITSFETGEYFISVCTENVKMLKNIVQITEKQLITKAFELKKRALL